MLTAMSFVWSVIGKQEQTICCIYVFSLHFETKIFRQTHSISGNTLILRC